MNCKYWDCGWCYAPKKKDTNNKSGQCVKPKECGEFNKQLGQHYIAKAK